MQKIQKRLIVALIAAMFTLAIVGMQTETAFAAEVVESGICGDNVTWTFNSEGVLTISGSGAMEDYAGSMDAPYIGNDIVTLIIEDGVTTIGTNAFSGLFFDLVMLPSSLTSIGNGAFELSSVQEAHFSGDLKQWNDNVIIGSGNEVLTNVIRADADVTYTFVASDASRGFSLADGVLHVWDHNTECVNPDTCTWGDPRLPAFREFDAAYSEFKSEYRDYVYGADFDLTHKHLSPSMCAGLTSLSAVSIPEDTISLDSSAFSGCTSLVSISIPDSVTKIANSVFSNCTSLRTVTISNGLTVIQDYAFSNCTALREITLPEGVNSIGYHAFSGCKALTNIVIPSSVDYIGPYAFEKCENLLSISLQGGITRIETRTFDNCSMLTSIVLPDNLDSIADYAFYGCSSLANVIIPDSVTVVGQYAFAGCSSLSSVTLSSGMSSISYATFQACKNLTTISIPDSITSIDGWAFAYSGLINVDLPDTISSIGSSAFACCYNLVSIDLPNSLTYISDSLLYGCGELSSITLPDGVTEIKVQAFSGCHKLESISIPSSLTNVNSYAFSECDNLRFVYFDGSQTQWAAIVIGDNNTNLTDAYVLYPIASGVDGTISWVLRANGRLRITGTGTIPDYATAIDAPWSSYKDRITSLYIGPYITDIGANAFIDLASLVTIDSLGSVATIGDNAFSNCTALEMVSLPETLTTIGDNAFSNCTTLTTLSLPNTIIAIGSSAFDGCASLSKVSIGPRVVRMGENVFKDCTLLTAMGPTGSSTDIEFAWKTVIPENAFSGANCLESITIPEGITRIMQGAFQNCTSISSVSLPLSLKTIQANAFNNCSALTSISIPAGVINIGTDAFVNCSGLTEIIVDPDNTAYCSGSGVLFNSDRTELILYPTAKPDTSYEIPISVTSVANNAFNGNTYLTEIIVHEALTDIGDYAFNDCSSITDVWYDSTDVKWNSINIGNNNEPLIQSIIHAAHEYGEPVWTWAEDYDVATAIFTCLNGDSTQVVTAIVTSEVVEATCEEGAYRVHTATITFEGVSYSDSTSVEIAPPQGHDWGEWEVTTEPTCAAEGKEARTCGRCNETETRAIEKIAHTPAAAVEENRTEPTCMEEGHYEEVSYCEVCGAEVSRDLKPIAALGHSYEGTVTEPTCTEQGYTTYTCGRCSDSYVDNYTDALGHDWGEWEVTTEPTCAAEGEEARTCGRCNETETRAIEKIAHTPGEAVKEIRTAPTCEDAGSYDMVVYCSECGIELSRDSHPIDATGHNYTVFYEWSNDYSNVLAFAVCTNNSKHVVTETVSVVSEVTKPATEYEKGETTYTAVFTNEVFETQTKTIDNIDRLPHSYKTGDANDDGSINAIDRILLSRYLAGWPGILPLFKDINVMDINLDHTVNAKDRVILSRYLANWGELYNSYFK